MNQRLKNFFLLNLVVFPLLWDPALCYPLFNPSGTVPHLLSSRLKSLRNRRIRDHHSFPQPPCDGTLLKMGKHDEEISETNVNGKEKKPKASSKKQSSAKRRKMELGWCGRDSCSLDESIRERVYGDLNEIEFDHPATGQVTYSWSQEDNDEEIVYATPSVLILVKRSDDELLKVAADVSGSF